MTARDFANALGMSENRYARYERGTSEPNFETLAIICQRLGVTPNDLLGFATGSLPALSSVYEPDHASPVGSTHASPYPQARANTGSPVRIFQPAIATTKCDVMGWKFANAYVSVVTVANAPSLDVIAAVDHDPGRRLSHVAALFHDFRLDPLGTLARVCSSDEFARIGPEHRTKVTRHAEELLRIILDDREITASSRREKDRV